MWTIGILRKNKTEGRGNIKTNGRKYSYKNYLICIYSICI